MKIGNIALVCFPGPSKERATNATEQLFSDLREAVRNCRTFAALHLSEKEAIERIIFNVRPLLSG